MLWFVVLCELCEHISSFWARYGSELCHLSIVTTIDLHPRGKWLSTAPWLFPTPPNEESIHTRCKESKEQLQLCPYTLSWLSRDATRTLCSLRNDEEQAWIDCNEQLDHQPTAHNLMVPHIYNMVLWLDDGQGQELIFWLTQDRICASCTTCEPWTYRWYFITTDEWVIRFELRWGARYDFLALEYLVLLWHVIWKALWLINNVSLFNDNSALQKIITMTTVWTTQKQRSYSFSTTPGWNCTHLRDKERWRWNQALLVLTTLLKLLLFILVDIAKTNVDYH